jgi:hypothetical protein
MSKKQLDDIKIKIAGMNTERSSFISHWRELSEYLDPVRGRFFLSDRNKGDRRHHKIINSRAGQALRTYQSGMFAGIMSPARPWFKLEPVNAELMASEEAKVWLFKVETLMRNILLDGNLYSMAPVALGEQGLFGTAAMSHLDDFDSVARFYTHTAGSYMIAQNDKHVVDTFALERERTVKQLVDEYGMDNVSHYTRTKYENNQRELWVPVTQYIAPNPAYNPEDEKISEMPFISYTFENSTTDGTLLKKSGFEEFPVHVARFALTAEDVYSTNSPGMLALGDIKSLQIMEKRKAQGIDKMVNPPLKGPPSLRDVPVSSLPGGLTVYDGDGSREGLTTIYQVEPRINELSQEIGAVENRINEAFFVDLFLAISSMQGVQPRNQLELTQRNEERLLMLGPSLERLQQDFLSKIVERLFNQVMRANIVPPPPKELQAESLNIRFVSAIAQAQASHEVGTVERSVAFVGQLAGIDPDVLDKLNTDEAFESYVRLIGGNPSILVPDAEVMEIRQQRAAAKQAAAKAQQAQQQAGALASTAKAGKTMIEAEAVGQALPSEQG